MLAVKLAHLKTGTHTYALVRIRRRMCTYIVCMAATNSQVP